MVSSERRAAQIPTATASCPGVLVHSARHTFGQKEVIEPILKFPASHHHAIDALKFFQGLASDRLGVSSIPLTAYHATSPSVLKIVHG